MCYSSSYTKPHQVTGTLTDSFFCVPCAWQILYKTGGDMGDGRREGCWAAGVMFRGRVLGRTQIHGRAGQGTALRSGKGWDALCAILCDTGFVPGPFICLKHCRSKVTPSRFVCISYFPRKKKWSSNVYWQSWENKKYSQISNSITAPFCILLLLNQQHCPKPPVSWGMILFKHILGYCAKTSPLCLDFEPMS